MGKKKIEKMKKAKAGLYIPPERAAEIMADVEAWEMPDEFKDGAAVVLGFLSTPEDSPHHGEGFGLYLDWYVLDKLRIGIGSFERALDELERSMDKGGDRG